MKKTLFVTIFILLSAFAFSQELIIVVAPFEVKAGSGFSTNDAETIEYLLLNELSKSKTLKVLDQSDAMFKETIKRMDFELSDWSNPKKVAEFGKSLNANAVLLGRIMTLGNELIIAVRINDLNTEIKAANDMVVTNVSEVRSKLPAFTKEIVDRLPAIPTNTVTNPLVGKWKATKYFRSNNITNLTYIFNLTENKTITFDRYEYVETENDDNKISYHLYTLNITGSYSYITEGNKIRADLILSERGPFPRQYRTIYLDKDNLKNFKLILFTDRYYKHGFWLKYSSNISETTLDFYRIN